MKFQPVEIHLWDRELVFRSLQPADLDALRAFYAGLSDLTRAFLHHRADAQGRPPSPKTKNRSVVGMMTEFAFLGGAYTESSDVTNLVELSLWLARTPCGPLHSRQGSPDRELALAAHITRRLG